MSVKYLTGESHLRYFVARDYSGSVCVWVEPKHDSSLCDTCSLDYRFPFGPNIVLMKQDTEPVVWDAACRVLLGGK